MILRDIHRTFPAHEFFKEAGGIGQESLYRISKAYSVYDSEIGYCQGQSFLIGKNKFFFQYDVFGNIPDFFN